ncbi:Cupredoxin [Paraphysoderma sedebokerense]|nr:Cupredoxin [Paraphysoderma sedebokerense]
MRIHSFCLLLTFVAAFTNVTFATVGDDDIPFVKKGKSEENANPCPRGDNCKIRQYYISAEEVDWDYAPSGTNMMTGKPLDSNPETLVFVEQGKGKIGKVYRKALFFEYTDDSFKTRKEKPQHLGFLGPIIRGEVGDVIKIKFKNKASFVFSMHPHGLRYTLDNEGANYNGAGAGAGVLPNETFEYVWPVPERAGPGPNDQASSILWAYHSHHMEPYDLYTGLMGPIIVYKPGILDSETNLPLFGTSAFPVDSEFVTFWQVTNEAESNYVFQNLAKYAGNTTTADGNTTVIDLQDPAFVETNMMHSINGRIYSNLEGLNLTAGSRARWYVAGFGSEVDIHSVHWHGATLLLDGHRVDVVEVFPATFRVLDMTVDSPGKWLLHCHVADHMEAGMTSFFYVEDGPVPLDAKPAGAGTWGAIVGMTAGLLLVSGLTIRATHKADDDY